MAQRSSSSSRGRRSSRDSGSGNSNQMMVIGGVGVAIVVAVFVVMRGGKEPAKAPTPAPAVSQPAAPAPAPAAAVPSGAARAGSPPARPAPALTQETLSQVMTLTRQAESLYNEGVKARSTGDNQAARDQQAKARDVLEQIDKLLEPALRWQEEAQMENWAQPAEYVALEKVYGDVSKLTKKVRMGGGK